MLSRTTETMTRVPVIQGRPWQTAGSFSTRGARRATGYAALTPTNPSSSRRTLCRQAWHGDEVRDAEARWPSLTTALPPATVTTVTGRAPLARLQAPGWRMPRLPTCPPHKPGGCFPAPQVRPSAALRLLVAARSVFMWTRQETPGPSTGRRRCSRSLGWRRRTDSRWWTWGRCCCCDVLSPSWAVSQAHGRRSTRLGTHWGRSTVGP